VATKDGVSKTILVESGWVTFDETLTTLDEEMEGHPAGRWVEKLIHSWWQDSRPKLEKIGYKIEMVKEHTSFRPVEEKRMP
jgi:hypothetical protein